MDGITNSCKVQFTGLAQNLGQLHASNRDFQSNFWQTCDVANSGPTLCISDLHGGLHLVVERVGASASAVQIEHQRRAHPGGSGGSLRWHVDVGQRLLPVDRGGGDGDLG